MIEIVYKLPIGGSTSTEFTIADYYLNNWGNDSA